MTRYSEQRGGPVLPAELASDISKYARVGWVPLLGWASPLDGLATIPPGDLPVCDDAAMTPCRSLRSLFSDFQIRQNSMGEVLG